VPVHNRSAGPGAWAHRVPSVLGVSTPRHELSPPARIGRDREDAVVRQRLRAVTRSGRPALAWHPATGALAQVDARAARADDGDVPWRDVLDRPARDGGWGDVEQPGEGTGVALADEEVGWLPARPAEGAPASTARDDVGPMRRRAAETVANAYTAAHGHPTAHSGFAGLADEGAPRWSLRPRTAVVALVVVMALAAGVVALQLPTGGVAPVAQLGETADAPVTAPQEEDAPAAASVPPEGSAPEDPTAGASVPGGVVVHVVGQVVAPGLVTVPPDARVADALEAAGGATPDADLAALNLARAVTDGEQIVVPRPGEAVAAPDPAGGAGGTDAGPAGGPLDLNAADAATLDTLPGIGPVLAERIVAWRDENGPFTTVDELGEVSGIGPAVLADVRDLVRV